MNKGPVITAIFTVIALGAVVTAFISNASPFVTIAQAKQTSGDGLHLVGDVVPDSIRNDAMAHILKFKLKDQNGEEIGVRYTGEIPNNLGEVKRVVAIGKIDGNEFDSAQLLVKCPSKYEAERKVASK